MAATRRKVTYVPPRLRPAGAAYLGTIVRQFVDRRHQLGLHQADIDQALNAAERYTSKLECGERSPSLFYAHCWAEQLDAVLMLVPKELAIHVARIVQPPLLGGYFDKQVRREEGP